MSSLTEDAQRQLQLADSTFHYIFFLVLTAVEVNPAFTLIKHSVRSDLLCSNSTEPLTLLQNYTTVNARRISLLLFFSLTRDKHQKGIC